MLDGGSLGPYSSQNVGRCSSAVPHYKRSHCGCLCRPGAQGSAISTFNPLTSQNVLLRQGFSSSVLSGSGGGNSSVYISSVGRNGQVGVLDRVYQTMPSLPLNKLIFWYIYFRLAWPGVPLVYIVLLFLLF